MSYCPHGWGEPGADADCPACAAERRSNAPKPEPCEVKGGICQKGHYHCERCKRRLASWASTCDCDLTDEQRRERSLGM